MSETKKSGIDYWKQIVVVMSLGWVAIWIYRTVLTPIYPEIQASLDNVREGANKRGNSSRLTQSFHFFMFEPIFSPVNALNQPI